MGVIAGAVGFVFAFHLIENALVFNFGLVILGLHSLLSFRFCVETGDVGVVLKNDLVFLLMLAIIGTHFEAELIAADLVLEVDGLQVYIVEQVLDVLFIPKLPCFHCLGVGCCGCQTSIR